MEPVSDEDTTRDRTPADIAFMEAIELAIDESSLYPDGAEFIDSDKPYVGTAIAEAFAEGRAVVLCTPDGRRLVLKAPRPAAA
jgi:hypothetical protein